MRVREVFSQKATGDLGAEIIITSTKRIVKFREGDESSGGLLAESCRRPRLRVSSPQANRM